jgi:hypothetical protein
LVYDCLAELFERGEDGREFVRLRQYLLEQNPLQPTDSDEAALAKLQQIVFIRTHHGLVRIHAELDPVLERILRSLKRFVDQGELLTIVRRLGEDTLVVMGDDPAWDRPPMPPDVLHQTMAAIVRSADSIRSMAEKLYGALRSQQEYQRAAGLLSCALLFKELSEASWDAEREQESAGEEIKERDDVETIIQMACRQVAEEMRLSYVGRRKRTEQEFQAYIDTVQKVFVEQYVHGNVSPPTFYEGLKARLGEHSVDEYRSRHRKVLEYLSKLIKRRLAERLRATPSVEE